MHLSWCSWRILNINALKKIWQGKCSDLYFICGHLLDRTKMYLSKFMWKMEWDKWTHKSLMLRFFLAFSSCDYQAAVLCAFPENIFPENIFISLCPLFYTMSFYGEGFPPHLTPFVSKGWIFYQIALKVFPIKYRNKGIALITELKVSVFYRIGIIERQGYWNSYWERGIL